MKNFDSTLNIWSFDFKIIFLMQKIIDKNSVKISIEASSIFGWEKYIGNEGISFGLNSFGKSAPYKKIYEHFNLTSDNIVKKVRKILDKQL